MWRMFSFRFWKKQPVTTLVIGLIIALGVATYLSIKMANRAAIGNFSLFSEVISDGSDWVVDSASGTLSSADLCEIRSRLGDLPVAILPIVETTIRPLEGVSNGQFRSYRLIASDTFALRNLLHESRKTETTAFKNRLEEGERGITCFVTPDIALRHDLSPGDSWEVFLQDSREVLLVSGVFSDAVKEEQSLNNLVFTDISQVADKLNSEGLYKRVELVVPEGFDREENIAKVGPLLMNGAPGYWSVSRFDDSNDSTLEMTQAFRLNLIVLSLISLLVCVFLILQGLDASVVRRRKEIATLRSLGMSPKEIQMGWLFEAAVLGTLGSVVGVILGGLMAQVLVRQIANTVNTLYRSTSVESASMTTGDVVTGLAIGIILSLISGYLPSKDAAATPPAQILTRGNSSDGLRVFTQSWIGWVSLLLAAICYFMPVVMLPSGNPFPLWGYGSAFFAIIGAIWLAIFLFKPVAFFSGLMLNGSAVWVNGMRRLRLSESRQKLAVAGLVIAISMAGGMSILVSSFERSMLKWVDYTFDADLFISSQSATSGDAFNRISAKTFNSIKSQNGVVSVVPYAQYPIAFENRNTFVAGTTLSDSLKWERYIWIQSPSGNPFINAGKEKSCIVNESFSNHFRLRRGDTFTLQTPEGPKLLEIVGVHSDYSSDRGLITLPINTIYEWFGSENITNISVYIDENQDSLAVAERWSQAFPGLAILSNRDLRLIIQKIFRDTFAVTQSIKWLGLFIAMSGLALSLFCILLENRGNLMLFQRLGMNRLKIAQTTAVEGLGLSAIGLSSGLLLSLFLGNLLIFVINKQSFGWTLQYFLPWSDLLLFSMFILLVGYFVSFWVGFRNHSLPTNSHE
jgi:putative ABC transport system permease protein